MVSQDKTVKTVLWILLIICMVVLTRYILFKKPPHVYMDFFFGNHNEETIQKGWSRANLRPFFSIRFFYRIGSMSFYKNVLGNLIGFVPLGILLPLLFAKLRRWWKLTIFIFLLSLSFETIQLITGWGMFDVDDIILNTSGGFLGFILYYAATKVFIPLPHENEVATPEKVLIKD